MFSDEEIIENLGAIKTVKDKLLFIFEQRPQYFEKIPEFEREIFYVNVIKNIDQNQASRLLGVTQGNISSRLSRTLKRLVFMISLEKYDLQNLDTRLKDLKLTDIEIEICKGMLETTCQSWTADRVNGAFQLQGKKRMNQVKVRHRFLKCLELFKEQNDRYYCLFKKVFENSYLLANIKLPHFYRG